MTQKPRVRSLPCRDWEIRAYLGGRTTAFVRPLKKQPTLQHYTPLEHVDGTVGAIFSNCETIQGGIEVEKVWCPFGKPGDVLVCKERWSLRSDVSPRHQPEKARRYALYRSNYDPDADIDDEWHFFTGWKSAVTMPAELARIKPTISEVRVVQLGKLTEADCAAMGFDGNCGIGHYPTYKKGPLAYHQAVQWEIDYGYWNADAWAWFISVSPPPQAIEQ